MISFLLSLRKYQRSKEKFHQLPALLPPSTCICSHLCTPARCYHVKANPSTCAQDSTHHQLKDTLLSLRRTFPFAYKHRSVLSSSLSLSPLPLLLYLQWICCPFTVKLLKRVAHTHCLVLFLPCLSNPFQPGLHPHHSTKNFSCWRLWLPPHYHFCGQFSGLILPKPLFFCY